MSVRKQSGILVFGLALVLAVLRSFVKGAPDFGVFHHAFELVINGRIHELYVNSPDRYLYSPGFAILFSPLGLLRFEWALLLWNCGKLFLFFVFLKELARSLHSSLNRVCWSARSSS